jgi:hypothetical protein
MGFLYHSLVINEYGLFGGIIIGREEAQCSEENLPQCLFIRENFHINQTVTESAPVG